MAFERAVPGAPGESPPMSAPAMPDGTTLTPSMRLQILSTEHWSLLASRSLAWNEAFARVGMYLTLVSGAIVALALVGQGSGFGEAFLTFGVVILPVVLFVGIATFLRLGSANYHDARCVIGMNRIRAGYLEMAPDLERFFVMGVHDDQEGIGRTMALEPGTSQVVHLLASTPAVVIVVDSVLAGAIAGLVALLADVPVAVVVAAAIVVFSGAFVAHVTYARGRVMDLQGGHVPAFPSRGQS